MHTKAPQALLDAFQLENESELQVGMRHILFYLSSAAVNLILDPMHL